MFLILATSEDAESRGQEMFQRKLLLFSRHMEVLDFRRAKTQIRSISQDTHLQAIFHTYRAELSRELQSSGEAFFRSFVW